MAKPIETIELGSDGAFDLDACASMPVGDAPDSDDDVDDGDAECGAPAFVQEARAAGVRAKSAAMRAAEKAARLNAASAAAAVQEEAHRKEMEAFAAAKKEKEQQAPAAALLPQLVSQ